MNRDNEPSEPLYSEHFTTANEEAAYHAAHSERSAPGPSGLGSMRAKAVPGPLLNLLSGLRLPEHASIAQWGQWIMETAQTVPPEQLISVIKGETHLQPALAALVASTALGAVAESLRD